IDDTLLDLRRDADAMTALLTDLLLTAEGSNVVPDVPTTVADAAHDAIEAMTPLASEAGVILDLRAEPSVLVDVPRVTVTRVAIVLLDNAIQHAPTGSTVSMTVGRDGRATTLRVADRGGGIVGIDPDRVFDRFARSGETGRRRGFGIGLALVKEVATRYGGDVTVESTSSEGTVFLLTLPAARRATNDSRA
ncbi:MAG: sensor histidine kinase, partial [Humibacter sp.]